MSVEGRLGKVVPDELEIRPLDELVHIFVEWVPVKREALRWRREENAPEGFGPVLTLGEIREQLRRQHPRGILMVMDDDFLHGYIFQTGNYLEETAWRVYGVTQGFA